MRSGKPVVILVLLALPLIAARPLAQQAASGIAGGGSLALPDS